MARSPERPIPSSLGVRVRMSAKAVRDTAPELALRKELHARGLRYRVCYPVPDMKRRTIDIAFPRLRLAVTVLGCFWHGCRDHKTIPTSNKAWWQAKIRRNQERDAETSQHLLRSGWCVVTVWEHETPLDAANRVEAALQALRSARGIGEPSRPNVPQ
jgi:DNA mismatch endonuclease, patch repair protein